MPNPRLNFQDLIERLHAFWSAEGCLLWQPYSEKVGAGTMNPATVLRCLGPEPWNVAYAEPSYRPDDGRYGENPNRMQMHTQYQVILKPDPGDPLEMYLGSLDAIGIGIDAHDVRFVEDNWESPALGAWGLGWEVWLDGMEITQFTYFQQAGSRVLDTPAVEITYGLERIAMFLQGVRKVWDVQWDDSHTYGEILLRPEIDHCRYDFEVADVSRLLQLYKLYEEEANAAIAAGLVVPAQDYVLRCSHTFNVLDARGAIGVTERAGYFGRMRDLTARVAGLYVDQREAEGFPWLRLLPPKVDPVVPPIGPALGEAEDFVLELGAEELPPQDLQGAVEQWKKAVPELLAALRLSHEGVTVSGTPRRVAVVVKSLAPKQTESLVEVRGPHPDRAYDAEGKPTQAALGFAKGQGVAVESLEVRGEGKKASVVAVKRETGGDAGEVLAAALPGLISGLSFGRAMRWDATGVAFSRPVRWLLALHGPRVVPFAFAGLVSGRTTKGTRPAGSKPIEVARAAGYLPALAANKVLLREERRAWIAEHVAAIAERAGGVTPEDADLLDEVTDLVEWPVAVLGGFEEAYLSLPKDVLITVMRKHQRYFPVVDAKTGAMLPHFVAVANGEHDDMALVTRGYEDVLRARYADADFFLKQDLKKPLADFVPRLGTLMFQERLGSMLDKQGRVETLAAAVAGALGLSDADKDAARRVARLCKADLATGMVVEMTSLAGVMGRYYAERAGEPALVAESIYQHQLPRFAGDALPSAPPALAVGIADRLDSLVGLFAVGLKPGGSADPYGLRRTAMGLVQILIERGLSLDLRDLLAAAAGVQPVPPKPSTLDDVWQFVADRARGVFRDRGLPHDAVEACLNAGRTDLNAIYQGARVLAEATKADDWPATLVAYARCKRIVRPLTETFPLAPGDDPEPASKALLDAYRAAEAALGPGADVPELVAVLRGLREPIHRFFTDLMVMSDDESVRRARLGLVQHVAALPDGLADLSRLNGF